MYRTLPATGSELGNIATSRPGEVGYMPSDPAKYNEAVSRTDAERWKESMRDEAQPLIDHDEFDWGAPPESVNPIPTKFIYKWKYNQDGIPIRPKSRVVVQGFMKLIRERTRQCRWRLRSLFIY